jgi:hypothetical protein
MKIEDLKWSKTRAQCPYCQGWFTRQGILGHIRFKHPDRSNSEHDSIKSLLSLKATEILMEANKMMADYGRLTPEFRERLFDIMLLDYLHKLSQGKS